MLTVTCRSCGHHLLDASERKLGRHNSCPSTFDEHTLALLKEWRVSQAAEESLPAYCIFTDATLIAIAEARPQSRQDLIKIHGLGQAKATKYGDAVLKILG